MITIDFGSLNYTEPEKKHYAYRHDGLDDACNDVGTKRAATYTNLNPGTDTAQVKGWDNDGNWSPTIATPNLDGHAAILASPGGSAVLCGRLPFSVRLSQRSPVEGCIRVKTQKKSASKLEVAAAD